MFFETYTVLLFGFFSSRDWDWLCDIGVEVRAGLILPAITLQTTYDGFVTTR